MLYYIYIYAKSQINDHVLLDKIRYKLDKTRSRLDLIVLVKLNYILDIIYHSKD